MTPGPSRPTVADVRGEFFSAEEYLDTATLGLPPRRTVLALEGAVEDWRIGISDAAGFDAHVQRSRALFAELVAVPEAWVAVGHQASPFVGLVAASVPDGAEVLVAEGEFTSVTFPFAAQARRGVVVREAPLEALADAVTERTHLVAVAAVQSADGRLADLDAIEEACRRTGTRTLVDLTQAAGWLPVDAGRFDWTVTSAYKWLLSPRGTAFLTARPERWDEVVPSAAGWYAGDERWSSIYGLPLRLAPDARRFDVSPGWHAWVGTQASLGLLVEVGRDALHAHAVGLADRFRGGVGLEPTGSAIVSLAADPAGVRALGQWGYQCAERAGRLRLSFHVHNEEHQADGAARCLRGHLL